MISFETSDRSCQWKNSHVNHETESAVLWKSWIWRLFCSYVDVLHSSFNNNVKISYFFFNLRFLSHRFQNEGNHQFIYRTPTRFLTMGLLFTRLWSLFTNEGMWRIFRYYFFSWYHLIILKRTCWLLQECALWRIQDHYIMYTYTCYTNENLVLLCQRLWYNKNTRLSFMFITFLCNHSITKFL